MAQYISLTNSIGPQLIWIENENEVVVIHCFINWIHLSEKPKQLSTFNTYPHSTLSYTFSILIFKATYPCLHFFFMEWIIKESNWYLLWAKSFYRVHTEECCLISTSSRGEHMTSLSSSIMALRINCPTLSYHNRLDFGR